MIKTTTKNLLLTIFVIINLIFFLKKDLGLKVYSVQIWTHFINLSLGFLSIKENVIIFDQAIAVSIKSNKIFKEPRA